MSGIGPTRCPRRRYSETAPVPDAINRKQTSPSLSGAPHATKSGTAEQTARRQIGVVIKPVRIILSLFSKSYKVFALFAKPPPSSRWVRNQLTLWTNNNAFFHFPSFFPLVTPLAACQEAKRMKDMMKSFSRGR